ncbi:MAG: portal protein, partial [Enterobacterales bacterium]
MRIPGRKRSKIPKIWEKLSRERNEFLDRAKRYAMLTLPYLIEEASAQPGSQNGWQGVGAQSVNHLANKLAQVLFPPQRSFFRIDLTQKGEESIAKAGYKKTELASLFAVVETQAMK